MCLLILNQTSLISKKHLKNSWENNSHGGGISYVKTDKRSKTNELVISKYTEFEDFYDSYRDARQSTNMPMILHFRISSSGARGYDNIHPFFVRDGKVAMGHNGTIHSLGDDEVSDSRQLAQIIGTFKGNSIYMLNHSGLNQLINAVISSSKLVFIDAQGNFKIFNEHIGHWTANGDWMSNDSYKKLNNWVYQGNKKVSKYSVTSADVRITGDNDYLSKPRTKDLWDELNEEQFNLETNTWEKI
tara:strand:- start:1877 stop:2608 length:732 start_codon:yes stop_codon:yes gene_type:complete